jgi:hypothetical protein
MVSFHTVAPEELIEETPVDINDLDGQTHQSATLVGVSEADRAGV